MIRAFREADLHEVCQLHQANFGEDGKSLDVPRLASFYRETFLDSPFAHPNSPSLVWENLGKVEGFLGLLTRDFSSKSRSYRIGIGSRYMVSPGAMGLVGASLLRAVTRGSLDLFFTDGANDEGRKAMMALGGEEVPLYCFQWLKLFQPFKFIAKRLKQRARISGLLLQGISPLLDLSTGILPGPYFKVNRGSSSAACGINDVSTLYQAIEKKYTIYPSYKKNDLEWLIRFSNGWKQRGEFHLRKVVWRTMESGGFSGYLRKDGIFEILNLWASPKRRGDLLDAVFSFVKQNNGVGVQGQILGGFLSPLRARGVFFKKGSWALAKGKDPALLHLLHSGELYMGGFEGELWLPSGRRGHE